MPKKSSSINLTPVNRYMAIKAPFKSKIIIPDPREIERKLKSIGCPANMMKKYIINIELPKLSLSA